MCLQYGRKHHGYLRCSFRGRIGCRLFNRVRDSCDYKRLFQSLVLFACSPVELNDNPAVLLSDIALFAENQAVPYWTITTTFGPFEGSDIESVLVSFQRSRGPFLVQTFVDHSQDEEYIGALAPGCTQYYYTVALGDGFFEWTNDLIESDNPNKIWSVSWGGGTSVTRFSAMLAE